MPRHWGDPFNPWTSVCTSYNQDTQCEGRHGPFHLGVCCFCPVLGHENKLLLGSVVPRAPHAPHRLFLLQVTISLGTLPGSRAHMPIDLHPISICPLLGSRNSVSVSFSSKPLSIPLPLCDTKVSDLRARADTKQIRFLMRKYNSILEIIWSD